MAQKKITDLTLRSDFDATCNLPVDDLTQTFRVTGAQILAYINTYIRDAKTSPAKQWNLGLSTSVGSNALTIALKQADGATDPTSTDPVKVAFRDSALTTGSYSLVAATGALSLVVPSSASLGHTSAMNQYVWVYLLNNSGTLELGVSGVKLFDDYSVQSSTTISAAATNGTILYSGTARTNVAIRLIGRILVSEAAAGTWATAPAEISLVSGKQNENLTDYVAYTPVFTGFGTVTGINIISRREAGSLRIQGVFTVGTPTSVEGRIAIGYNGTSGNVTSASTLPTLSYAGKMIVNKVWSIQNLSATMEASKAYFTFGFGDGASNVELSKRNGDAIVGGNATVSFNVLIPVAGWSTFGP